MPNDGFEEVEEICFAINITTAVVTLALILVLEALAFYKYRRSKYDKVSFIVLLMFALSFAIRLSGYVIQDWLEI